MILVAGHWPLTWRVLQVLYMPHEYMLVLLE
jgi:hypothetical protein